MQLGVGWCERTSGKALCAVLGVDAEYSLRYSPFEPEPYVGVSLGVLSYTKWLIF